MGYGPLLPTFAAVGSLLVEGGRCVNTYCGVVAWIFLQAGVTSPFPDTGAGWAGWAGFFSSGGVLVWLLFWHLPSKDKQLDKLLEDKSRELEAKDNAYATMVIEKDRQIGVYLQQQQQSIQTLSRDHVESVKLIAAEARITQVALSEHCDKQAERLLGLLEASQDRERNQRKTNNQPKAP